MIIIVDEPPLSSSLTSTVANSFAFFSASSSSSTSTYVLKLSIPLTSTLVDVFDDEVDPDGDGVTPAGET